MSIYAMAIMGTAPFGSLLAGWLAKLIGTQFTIMTGGLVCLAGALLFSRRLPELRNLVKPVYIRMGLVPEIVTGIHTASEPGVKT